MARRRNKIYVDRIRKIRKSPGVQSFTREQAERVAAAAGPGFAVKQGAGINRARYVVVPTTREAYTANAEEYALIRALGKV